MTLKLAKVFKTINDEFYLIYSWDVNKFFRFRLQLDTYIVYYLIGKLKRAGNLVGMGTQNTDSIFDRL